MPDAAFAPNHAPLPDARTGFAQTGRAIDPQTKSYTFTADGRVVGMGTVQQLVFLALTTVKGSSAIPSLGQTFSLIQEKGQDYVARVTSAVNSALADLVKQNLVQVLGIVVTQPPSNPDAGIVQVQWLDLTTGVVNVNNVGP